MVKHAALQSPGRLRRDRFVRFGFVLTPQFSLLALTGFVDALRELRDHGALTGRTFCEWAVLGLKGEPAQSSCGIAVEPTDSPASSDGYDYLVVIGGRREATIGVELAASLRRADRAGATLIGIDTGTFVLAREGLLDGCKCCIHWFHHGEFCEEFPRLAATAEAIFHCEDRRITCAGGTYAIDLATHLIAEIWGHPEASRASTLMGLERRRGPAHYQAPYFDGAPIVKDLRVRRAIQLIESRLDRPLAVDAIAQALGTSVRHLERAFHDALGLGPADFSRLLRLRHGHWLLLNSKKPIAQIAQDCGFSDSSHFTRHFRRHFDMAPRSLRNESSSPSA